MCTFFGATLLKCPCIVQILTHFFSSIHSNETVTTPWDEGIHNFASITATWPPFELPVRPTPWRKSEARRGRLDSRGSPGPGMWCQSYLPARWKIASRIRVVRVYWMEGVVTDCRLAARSFSRTRYGYRFLLRPLISMHISSGHNNSGCLPMTLTNAHCYGSWTVDGKKNTKLLTLHTAISQHYFMGRGRRRDLTMHNFTALLNGKRRKKRSNNAL